MVVDDLRAFFGLGGQTSASFGELWPAFLKEAMQALSDPDVRKAIIGKLGMLAVEASAKSRLEDVRLAMVQGVVSLLQMLDTVPDEARAEISNAMPQMVAEALAEGPTHLQELARRIDRDPGQVHRVVARMEAAGLVTHQQSDHRKVLSLTPIGKAALTEVRDGTW